MRNAGLDEAQPGIKIAERSISNLRYSDDTNGRKQVRTKKPLDKSERREWKSWLKTQHSESEDHGIQSHHFMENRRETMKIVTHFILGGSKITANGYSLEEIKICLFLGRRAMTNLDSIIKSKNILCQ